MPFPELKSVVKLELAIFRLVVEFGNVCYWQVKTAAGLGSGLDAVGVSCRNGCIVSNVD